VIVRDRLTVVAAACGLAGAIVFLLTVLIAGLAEPRFSFVHNATSDLGALTAEHALPYNVALSLSGALTVGLGIALFRFLARGRGATAGAILVGVFGAGQFVDGLAREDCSVSVSHACRAAADAGKLSTHHQVHDLESVVTFSALLLAPLVLASVFSSSPSLRALVKWSVGAAVFQAACLAVFFSLYLGKHAGVGVPEILDLTAGVVWIAAIAVVILRRRGALDEPRGATDVAHLEHRVPDPDRRPFVHARNRDAP
jgi:hypothetical membrane protein